MACFNNDCRAAGECVAEPGTGCRACPPALSGETDAQREEVCAAWHALPDDLRKDPRLTRLYHALGGPRMDDPAEAVAGPVCGNCDTALPEGCGGIFKDDGDACALNRTAGVGACDGSKP
jgi:hypothetical protein